MGFIIHTLFTDGFFQDHCTSYSDLKEYGVVDVTSQFDEVIHQVPYSQITMSIWIMWVAVVVVLIVLGLDFWRNLFGMWFFPRMNFSRIAGELQIIPNMFVALMFGLINGIIGFNYYRIDEIKGSFLAQMDKTIRPLLEQVAGMTQMPLATVIDSMKADPDYAYGLLALIPLFCGFAWFFYGLSLWLTSKFVSKSGGTLGNFLCGISYFSWLTPFLFLGYWIGFMNPSVAMVFLIIGFVLLVFYMTATLRDYFHIPWGNTLVAVVIVAPLIFVILMSLFVILMLMAVNQLGQYI